MIAVKPEYERDLDRLLRRQMRSLGRKGAKPIVAGLLGATDGAVERVRGRVPIGRGTERPGRLRRSVRRVTYFSERRRRMSVIVGFRTNYPMRKGRKTLPRFMQAQVSEYGSRARGYGSFTGRALRTVAEAGVFPYAAARYARAFRASYEKQLRGDVRGTQFRVSRR